MVISKMITVFIAAISVNLSADPLANTQVLGVSANKVNGNRNPAQRHLDRAETFFPPVIGTAHKSTWMAGFLH